MNFQTAYQKLPRYQKKLVSKHKISLERLSVLYNTVNQGWESFKRMKLSEFGEYLEKNGVKKAESFTIITIYGTLNKIMFSNAKKESQ